MKKLPIIFLVLFVFCKSSAQDFRFGKVSEEEVREKVHPNDKDANAAFLFREHKVYYEYRKNVGFSLITEVHERVKIYNKDGFDWATKEISYYEDGSSREEVSKIKGYTYNLEDGKLVDKKLRKSGIFKEDVTEHRVKTTFTMPDVKEGSVIEYRYTLNSPFLASIDEILLQQTIPINRLEASVTIPEYLGFRMHFNTKSPVLFTVDESRKNSSYNVSNSVRSGSRRVSRTVHTSKVNYIENVYSIKKDDIPALKEEAFIDYLKNYAAYLRWELQFTKFPDSFVENFSQTWEGVTKTIYDDGGYDKELSRTGYFEDEVDLLLEGMVTPEQKAVAIYNFVKNKVKWNDYNGFLPEKGVKSAFKDGEGNVGDINILLTAMLRYAGLNAKPVLVSTRDNGIPVYPTRSGFNYVVSGLELSDQFLYLDATDPTAAIGQLPERARNWQGRIIDDKINSAWVDLMPKQKSAARSVMNVQFDDNFSVKGKLIDIYNGFYAKSFRENYAGINKENYLQYLEKDKGNIAILNIETENEEEIGKDITQSFEFNLKDEIEVINGRVYFQPLLFEALEENPFKADERKYPINFDFPLVKEKVVNIMIPEGYEVESLPESLIVELNAGAGSFKFLVHQNGSFLRIESVLDLNNTFYTPADYEALKKFYGQIVDKQTEAIVLKKT